MADTKITFPRLKAISERGATRFSIKANTHNTIPTEQIRQPYSSFQEKIDTLKYKYINKSPNYFKHRNMSQKIRTIEDPNETIEHYVAEHKKLFDKQMLLEVARSRVKKLRMQSYSAFKKENQYDQKIDSMDRQTKYENFRPMQIPTKRTIRSLRHPDLTLPLKH